jgi:hypothetical protein
MLLIMAMHKGEVKVVNIISWLFADTIIFIMYTKDLAIRMN